MGLTLGIALESSASLAKGLKLKIRKCWLLIPTVVEVTWEKLAGFFFIPQPPFRTRLTLSSKLRNTYTFAQLENSKM